MPVYIALLRGINVSGQKKIKMAELRSLMENHGYQAVKTYIQSGNIIFDHSPIDPSILETQIATLIHTHYGFEVAVLVKKPSALSDALVQNPFKEREDVETKRLYLTFLAEKPEMDRLEALKTVDYNPEEYVIIGKNLYFYSPHGYGRAKMNNNFFEQKLKVKATTRNWRTINKLVEMSQDA